MPLLKSRPSPAAPPWQQAVSPGPGHRALASRSGLLRSSGVMLQIMASKRLNCLSASPSCLSVILFMPARPRGAQSQPRTAVPRAAVPRARDQLPLMICPLLNARDRTWQHELHGDHAAHASGLLALSHSALSGTCGDTQVCYVCVGHMCMTWHTPQRTPDSVPMLRCDVSELASVKSGTRGGARLAASS